ncbi:hypothetical protein Emed_006773 [Eimeria media]
MVVHSEGEGRLLVGAGKRPLGFRAVRNYLKTQNATVTARMTWPRIGQDFATFMTEDCKESHRRLPSPFSTCCKLPRAPKDFDAHARRHFSWWDAPIIQGEGPKAQMNLTTYEYACCNNSPSTPSRQEVELCSGQENETLTSAQVEQKRPHHCALSTEDESETPRALDLFPPGCELEFCLSNVSSSIDKLIEDSLARPSLQRPPDSPRSILRKHSSTDKGEDLLYCEEPQDPYVSRFPIGEIWASSATAVALAAAALSPRSTVSGLASLKAASKSDSRQVLDEGDVEAFLKAKKRTEEVAARIRNEVLAAREERSARKPLDDHAQSSSKKAILSLHTPPAKLPVVPQWARSFLGRKEQANLTHVKAVKVSVTASETVKRSSSINESHLIRHKAITQRAQRADTVSDTAGPTGELLAKGVRLQLTPHTCKQLLPTTSASMGKWRDGDTTSVHKGSMPLSAFESQEPHDISPKLNAAKLASDQSAVACAALQRPHVELCLAASPKKTSPTASRARQNRFVSARAAALGADVSRPAIAASQAPLNRRRSHNIWGRAEFPFHVASKNAESDETLLASSRGPTVPHYEADAAFAHGAKPRSVSEMNACSAEHLVEEALAARDVPTSEVATASTLETFCASPEASTERAKQEHAETLHEACSPAEMTKVIRFPIAAEQRQQQHPVNMRTELCGTHPGKSDENGGQIKTITLRCNAEDSSRVKALRTACARAGDLISRGGCAQALQTRRTKFSGHGLSCVSHRQKRSHSAPASRSTIMQGLSHENLLASIVTQYACGFGRLAPASQKEAKAMLAALAEDICTNESIAGEALTVPLKVCAQDPKAAPCAGQLLWELQADEVHQRTIHRQDDTLRRLPAQKAASASSFMDCAFTQKPMTFAPQCPDGLLPRLPTPHAWTRAFPRTPGPREGEEGCSEAKGELNQMQCEIDERKRPQNRWLDRAKVHRRVKNGQRDHLQEGRLISSSSTGERTTAQLPLRRPEISCFLPQKIGRTQNSHSENTNSQSNSAHLPKPAVLGSALLLSGQTKQEHPLKTLAPDSKVSGRVAPTDGARIIPEAPGIDNVVADLATSLPLQSRAVHSESLNRALLEGGLLSRRMPAMEEMESCLAFGDSQASKEPERRLWRAPIDKPDQAFGQRPKAACSDSPDLKCTQVLLPQMSQACLLQSELLAWRERDALQITTAPPKPQSEMQKLRQQLAVQRGEIASSLEQVKLRALARLSTECTRAAYQLQQLVRMEELQKQEKPKPLPSVPHTSSPCQNQQTRGLLNSEQKTTEKVKTAPRILSRPLKQGTLQANATRKSETAEQQGRSHSFFSCEGPTFEETSAALSNALSRLLSYFQSSMSVGAPQRQPPAVRRQQPHEQRTDGTFKGSTQLCQAKKILVEPRSAPESLQNKLCNHRSRQLSEPETSSGLYVAGISIRTVAHTASGSSQSGFGCIRNSAATQQFNQNGFPSEVLKSCVAEASPA